VDLLAQHQLLPTGPVDHANWNYLPVIGVIQRLRFRLIARLMGGRRFESLLEIGYGSGIFMPELARHAQRLAGVDIHARHVEVAGCWPPTA
jgi:2-polyprenyl-3-methyl-5-hydroxy-6-metoxy-1,4-benzoquinol methylase